MIQSALMVHKNQRGWTMRVATFSVGGERRVGLVDVERGTVATLDLPAHEAEHGLLALIDRSAGSSRFPATLSEMPLSRVTLEAPIPTPAAQYLLHRQELLRARARVHEERVRFQRRGWRGPEGADHLLQGARDRDRAGRPRAHRPVGFDGHRLRGGTCGHHRPGRSLDPQGGRVRPHLGGTRSSTT